VQIEVVQRATLERRLLPLQRHHQIGDRAAEEPMRHRNRRCRGKRHGVERRHAVLAVLAQDIALVAAGDHLVQARPAGALVVHPDVVLGDLDQIRGRIG
jgi:hypothetical protein